MEAKVKKEALSIAKSLNFLLLVGCGVLLVLSLVLAGSLAYVSTHQTQTLVPPTLTEKVTLSPTKVDAAYLSQMATYYLWLKMNVSPETVLAQYGEILKHVDSRVYHSVEPQFAREANFIKSQKISSALFIENSKVDVKQLTVDVTGSLKQYALGVALPAKKKAHYFVKFAYGAGRLTILSMSRVEAK